MTALNPQHTFDTFVVGSANRLAVTAARAVAGAPGAVYNPLFVYGAPGLGKTHLIMAIGHAAEGAAAPRRVAYVTCDEFSEAVHEAIAAGTLEELRRRYLALDVLLLDDVQFLGGRRELQAEVLRLLDAAQHAGRQVVLASDRPPAAIEQLDERLTRRVSGGLVVDMAAPDYETRVAILRRKAEERQSAFASGVLEALAAASDESVRELLGMLNRVIALQSVSEAPLTPAQVRELVAGRPAAAAPAEHDEFSDFLTELAASLAEQVAPWRTQVGEALLRWEGEGFEVRRLQAILDADVPESPEERLRAFEADANRLLEIRNEVALLAPDLVHAPALRDPAQLAAAEQVLARARERSTPPPAPSPIWRLDDLLEGPANRMALHAARAIVAEPGERYNPIVITGGPDAGKTHLLHAIGNALAERAGGPVACLGAGEFIEELIRAIDRNDVASWRARYRRAAALLLDDVHLLAGKTRTQEELFVLFNHFLEEHRQMVFATAVAPASLAGVEPRLLTRLEGGLVVELPPPDREVRQRFLERFLGATGDAADAALVAYLADRPADSLPQLQGLAQRARAVAEGRREPLSLALAREALEGPPAARPATGRPPGVQVPAGAGVRSAEKTVWDWPVLADRLVEEWR